MTFKTRAQPDPTVFNKPGGDSVWLSRSYRTLSHRVSPYFIRLGFTANQITVLSMVPALLGSFVLLWPSMTTAIVSVILINAFMLLDHVDGEVARYERSVGRAAPDDDSGAFLDFLVHCYQGPSFFICIGVGLSLRTGQPVWALIGLIAGLGSGSSPRLVAQKVTLGRLVKDPSHPRIALVESQLLGHPLGQGNIRNESYVIPRNMAEAKWLVKQLFGAPTVIFLFMPVAIIGFAISQTVGLIAIAAFLAVVTVLRLGVTCMSIITYTKFLSAGRTE